jgi:hypothetical protein
MQLEAPKVSNNSNMKKNIYWVALIALVVLSASFTFGRKKSVTVASQSAETEVAGGLGSAQSF